MKVITVIQLLDGLPWVSEGILTGILSGQGHSSYINAVIIIIIYSPTNKLIHRLIEHYNTTK